MKKIVSLFTVLLFFVVCEGKKNKNLSIPKKFEFTDSILVSNVTKDILFNRASMWVHESFKTGDTKIQIQDKASGVIFGDVTITDRQQDYTATFSLTLNFSDGKCYFVFNNYNNYAGNFNSPNPDCCLTDKKWRTDRAWANSETKKLIISLKDKISKKSPAEDFLTIPLQDTASGSAHDKNMPQQLHSQPVSYYILAGGAYAPGIFSSGDAGGGHGRYGGNTANGETATGLPITMYHITLGIFIPGRMDPSRGFGIEAGYYAFPMRIQQSEPGYVNSSGQIQQVQTTTTTNIGGVEFYPNYTLRSKKNKKTKLYTSIGLDLGLTTSGSANDMAGMKIAEGVGRNGFYLSGFVDLTLNNIYGSSGGGFRGNATSVKPLFLGLNLSFYPRQNQGAKKMFK